MSRRDGTDEATGDTDRAQLVLVAAAVVAVALVPMVLAYLQLGYHADVAATADHGRVGADTERALDRAVHNASRPVAGEYGWSARDGAVDVVDRRLRATTKRIERARLDEGVAVRIRRNDSAAAAWAARECPRGPDRRFGPCETDRAVVVQERADETAVLAVAFDVTVTGERSTTRLTLVAGRNPA
ncbi:hypothetical protein ACFO0N_11925 [Halobium salinum]|uniref:Flp pilus-assembly TadG-like N-terminal domain-containing protein n=1 Tax=Halobium salinum TaxID=1364940 RepID=A0ABD5PD53_9EURY